MDEIQAALTRIASARYQRDKNLEALTRIELAVKRVATAAGVKVYGSPIGSVITNDAHDAVRNSPQGHKKLAELKKHEKSPEADDGQVDIAVGEKSYKIPKGSDVYKFKSSAAGEVVISKDPGGVYHIYTNDKEYEAFHIDDVMIKNELARGTITKEAIAKMAAYDEKKDPSASTRNIDVGGKMVTTDELMAAIQALEAGKGTSILGPLKKIDSPLAKVDYRAILADQPKRKITAREAFIAYLKSLVK